MYLCIKRNKYTQKVLISSFVSFCKRSEGHTNNVCMTFKADRTVTVVQRWGTKITSSLL